jgi:hypothetical protein
VRQRGIVGAGDFYFFLWKGNENQLRTGFCLHSRLVSAVKRLEFVGDGMLCIVLRGRWCNIITHMKFLLGNFNSKFGREDIFQPRIWNECLHQDSNDNGVRIVNTVTSKIWLRARCSLAKILIYTWICSDVKTHNQIDQMLIDRRWLPSILSVRSFRGDDCDTDHYLAVAKVRERLQ